MLHRACCQYCGARNFSNPCTVLCRKLFSGSGTSASFPTGSIFVGRTAMQTLRQRRTSDRIATRSHTTHNPTDISESTDSLQHVTQPAAKKRKTTAAKPTRKGLKDRSTLQHQAAAPALLAEQATSSADTVSDATPAIPSALSGVPASIPAHVPADPNVLHCWTKESMAQAAAHLAERDPG